MAVRATLPKAGTFKKATTRVRESVTNRLAPIATLALPSHKGSFVQRGPAKQMHSLMQAQSGDYLRNGLFSTVIVPCWKCAVARRKVLRESRNGQWSAKEAIMANPAQHSMLIFARSLRGTGFALVLGCALAAVATQPGQAQTYTVIHDFTGKIDGGVPVAGLTMDQAGNLYGTTDSGGVVNAGGVFRLSKKATGWIFNPLYSFAGGADGGYPMARVIIGSDGTLYGTTFAGGTGSCLGNFGCGTVFNLRPQPRACTSALCPWVKTVLYRFTGGSDGGNPGSADLIFDAAGNLYGTTTIGGAENCSGSTCGVVFKLTPANGGWTESVLYSFTGGDDGGNPSGGVVFDGAGNLYGVTENFGAAGRGTVYELTPSGSGWTESTLYSFQPEAGKNPQGSLILDESGNLYGTTAKGFEMQDDGGSVYELTNSNNKWTRSNQYAFTGSGGPGSGVTRDTVGNLYGTTNGDGQYLSGSVFKLTPDLRSLITLHDFTGGGDGGYPDAGVLIDANGNIYGTTAFGGGSGNGVVFEITP
jgi:uncharacterized repeat protein (TIGR03803 family)